MTNTIIQEARLELGLSRKEMAELAGVSYSNYCNIEKGNNVPSALPLDENGDYYKVASLVCADIYTIWPSLIPEPHPRNDCMFLKLIDLMRIEYGDGPSNLESKDYRQQFNKALNMLTSRERYVIARRFGLVKLHYATLKEIGDSLFITRERVRNIEAKALRKLRHPSRFKHIKLYYKSDTRIA